MSAPRFAAHIQVIAADDHALLVFGERGCDVYDGPEYARLARLIDGNRPRDQLLAVGDGGDVGVQDAAAAALAQLERDGLVVAGDGPRSSCDGWWSSQLVAPGPAAVRVGQSLVDVRVLGGVDARPTFAALDGAGVAVAEEGEAALTLVLTGDYLDPALAEINARALRTAQPWLLAQPSRAEILVGPLFSPERGPCWECLAQRLRHQRGAERVLRERFGASAVSTAVDCPPALRGLGAGAVLSVLLRGLAGTRTGLEAMVSSLDTRTLSAERHTVVWRPQCPACGVADGVPGGAASPPVRLRSRLSPDGGALREVSPEVTLARFERHLSRVSGVVSSLARVAGPDVLHVYVANTGVPRVHGDDRGWKAFGHRAGGKGTSDVLARASALCEALERYSGGCADDRSRRRATIAELAETAIHPRDLLGFSAAQYRERARWNDEALTFRTYVPQPFDERRAIDWTAVWSLTNDRERFVPTCACYYDSGAAGSEYCIADSNGNAAGNTIEEAVLHGALELIERDHAALWWYNRLRAPEIALDSIADDWLAQLRTHLSATGRRLWGLDLTADLGVPVAAAVIAVPERNTIEIGLAAHAQLAQAVVRAATEACQLGLGAPSGGLGQGAAGRLRLDEHEFVTPDPAAEPVVCAAPTVGPGVGATLEACRDAIERQGIELLVLDQTQPDIGLPVVKVIAPGLRHFWPRFGPGRLYDVPVALGRLERPREEHELTRTYPIT